MPTNPCHHIQEDGVFCQAPALRGRRHCYFHFHALGRNMRVAQEKARQRERGVVLPPLVDMNAVQVSLQRVMNAILADRIDVDTAGRMLYGLQQASSNLRRAMLAASFAAQDEDEQEGRAEAYPDFEQEFHPPPEVALPAVAASG